MMAEIMQNLEPAIRESGAVVIHAALARGLGRPLEMTQLLQNLIGNAIKFRGTEPPEILVQAELVQAEKADSQWLFSVTDNGIGIAPEHAENIFVVFQRLHTRDEYSGNGIGLSICKKIIERCGGKIWVESEAGHGSVFKFTLPSRETGKRIWPRANGRVRLLKARRQTSRPRTKAAARCLHYLQISTS